MKRARILLSIPGLLLTLHTATAHAAHTPQKSIPESPAGTAAPGAALLPDTLSDPPEKLSAACTEHPCTAVRTDGTAGLSADTAARRRSFIRRIIDYYSQSNEDLSFRKKIDWSIVPGPNYSSDYGFGIGFMLAGFYRPDRTDSVTSPSNVSVYGNLTTRKYATLYFSGDNYFRHDRQILRYTGSIVYFPGEFYGVGHTAGAEGYSQQLTTTGLTLELSYCTALAQNLYAGLCGTFNYSGTKYAPSGMAEWLEQIAADAAAGGAVPDGRTGELYRLWQEGRYDPAKQDPFSNYIAATGENPDPLNTGAGIFVQYDSRDVTYNASKGLFLKTEALWYPRVLGNTGRDFGRVTVTFDCYRKLWKGAVLAYDFHVDATIGNPSWHMFAKLGGDTRMRGYYEGRYRDKRLAETQLELRQRIYRRHGIVGWVGAGQVWGTEPFGWDRTLSNFGCGYRFEFKKGMNIRLDYGWGVFGNRNLPWDRKRSSAFLFTASEAF